MYSSIALHRGRHRPVLRRMMGTRLGMSPILGVLADRVPAFIVYQATPRDPLVLAAVVLALSPVVACNFEL